MFADADLEDALDGVTFGVFFNNGECCVSQRPAAGRRTRIADDFLAAARGLRPGSYAWASPSTRATDVGAMIHDAHLAKVLGYVTGRGRSRAPRADRRRPGHRAELEARAASSSPPSSMP